MLFRAVALMNAMLLAVLPPVGSGKFLLIQTRAAATGRFRLEEATIADVHRAILAKQLTSTELVNLSFRCVSPKR
jgi:hypothetical protein